MSVQSTIPVPSTHDHADESYCELFLPRNLSYCEDSYLENFSVSSNFVWNPRQEIKLCDNKYKKPRDMNLDTGNVNILPEKSGACSSRKADDKIDVCEIETTKQNGRERTFSNESSEEGIFVNSMDDLDSEVSSNGRSQASDDLVDSINSPDESNLEESKEGQGASIGEAVNAMMNSLAIDLPMFKSSSDKKSEKQLSTSLPTLRLNVNEKPKVDGVFTKGSSQGALFDYMAADDSPDEDEDEFSFNRAKLRKSSSLKTNKTPPGTPRRKKMVRFADAMGLDLEDVRHVLNADAPPKIPPSAMKDLKVGIEEDRKNIGNRYLTACFQQPGACGEFLQKIMAQKVCLENAVVTNLTITGVIRVANIGFHKLTRVRYTTNKWVTFHDIMASYVQNSCDGPTDRFSFSIVAPADFGLNSKLEVAICYRVNDTEYWDSNDGKNYVFECFAKTTPTDTEDSWVHFL